MGKPFNDPNSPRTSAVGPDDGSEARYCASSNATAGGANSRRATTASPCASSASFAPLRGNS